MKKTTLITVSMLLGVLFANVQAAVSHGSIIKKGLSVTKTQGAEGEGPNVTGITVDFKLVSVKGMTYAWINGEGYTLANTDWAAQIRYGGVEKQCPVANREGNLCIWSYADHNNPADKVAVQIEDNNNFFQTEAFDYAVNACNSKDDADTEVPALSGATATATDNTVTINSAAADNSGEFFYIISSDDVTLVSYKNETVIEGLMSGTEYTFTVTAIDFSGNESTPKEVTISTTGETAAFDPEENLALNKPTTASLGTAADGNDGNIASRWRSDNNQQEQWWQVNLGKDYVINKVIIRMNGDPGARGAKYYLEVSMDGTEWTAVTDTTGGNREIIPSGGNLEFNEHALAPVPARYVRYFGTEKGGWDHNFAEFEVYGLGYYDPNASNELADVQVTPAQAVNYMGDKLKLTATAVTGGGMPLEADFTWTVAPATGASVDENNIFTATALGTYTVTATTTVGEITKSGTAVIEVQEGRKLSNITIARVKINNQNSNHSDIFLTSEPMPFELSATDQYGNPFNGAELIYEAGDGVVNKDANTVAWPTAGEKSLQVSYGDIQSEVINVTVVTDNPVDKAIWTATASSQADENNAPGKAIDNDFGTRWTSGTATQAGVAQAEALDIDMGTNYQLTAIEVMWEGATAKDYDVLVSADGETYTNLGGERRDVGIFNHLYRVKTDEGMDVQYIRIDCQVPATEYKYAIFEVTAHQVKGDNPTTWVSNQVQPDVTVWTEDGMLRFSAEVSQAQVYTLQGQLVLSAQRTAEISTDALTTGLYIVNATDETGKSLTAKVEIR